MQSFRLSGATQGMGELGIGAAAQEFMQVRRVGGIGEIFRQCIAQGGGGDELGTTETGTDGAQSGTERRPHFARVFDREILLQTLSDPAELDVQVVGSDLAADGVATALSSTFMCWVPAPQ